MSIDDGQLRLVGREMARLLEFEVAVQALFKRLISVSNSCRRKTTVGTAQLMYIPIEGFDSGSE